MTPMDCAQELAKFLQEKNADYTLQDEEVKENPINVYAGFLPLAKSSKEKAKLCPSIVVRPVEVEDQSGGMGGGISTVSLQLLFVTYNKAMQDGHLELYHLLEKNRQALLKSQTIGKRFRLSLPMKTMIPDEQPFPMWWGYMEVKYLIYQPREEGILDGQFFK